jgi:hypothetical protein
MSSNEHSRGKGTKSLDFMVVLLHPTVSAGHLVLQVFCLAVRVAQILTPTDIGNVQIARSTRCKLEHLLVVLYGGSNSRSLLRRLEGLASRTLIGSARM